MTSDSEKIPQNGNQNPSAPPTTESVKKSREPVTNNKK
jgi:hypothetical protein